MRGRAGIGRARANPTQARLETPNANTLRRTTSRLTKFSWSTKNVIANTTPIEFAAAKIDWRARRRPYARSTGRCEDRGLFIRSRVGRVHRLFRLGGLVFQCRAARQRAGAHHPEEAEEEDAQVEREAQPQRRDGERGHRQGGDSGGGFDEGEHDADGARRVEGPGLPPLPPEAEREEDRREDRRQDGLQVGGRRRGP